MGVDFGDLNGDGLLDIYVSNIAAPYALEEAHFLFLSTGDFDGLERGLAPYRHGSEELHLARSSWGWESRLADFDNDGGLEAVQATGFIRGETDRWPELQELAIANDGLLCGDTPNPFYVRAASGAFVDISAELGIDDPQVSRGIATADVDADGDLDFLVANQWEDSRLYRNDAPIAGRSLVLTLLLPFQHGAIRVDPAPALSLGHPAVGARVTVARSDGELLVGEVDGGNGHSGTRSPEVHFGLGDHPADQPISVAVRWRDPGGGIRRADLSLLPGRHTVVLGWPEGGAVPVGGATQ
jgi:hypothetical protein